jgi:hypothetical protein
MSAKLFSPTAARLVALCVGGLGIAACSQASSVFVHRNDVVPVKFNQTLSSADNRVGDRFSVTVSDDSVLPSGTRFAGHITRVEQKTRRHPAGMDLVFDTIDLPDGSRTSLDGAPIPLDSKYVSRDRDGHYTAKSSVSKDSAVGLGALGGLIIGSILHKPFEGAFVGILAGIAVAETAGNGDETLVIHRDASAGVLFRRDCHIEFSDRPLDGTRNRDIPRDPPRDLPRGRAIIDVQLGDRSLSYSAGEAPYDGPSAVMVPIEATAKQLGYSYDVADDRIYIENADHSLRLVKGDKTYRLDGQPSDMSGIVEERNGVLYAPVDVFGSLMGKKVSIHRNGTRVAL